MDTSSSPRTKKEALDIIEQFRVPDLQAVLHYARVSRQGCKRDLFIRCQLLITSQWSTQLGSRIHEVNQARLNSRRSWTLVRQYPDPSFHHSPMPLPSNPPVDNLPPPTQVQYARLPFYDPIRTIVCFNVPVNRKHFPAISFFFTDSDVDLILRGAAKVFLRIAPTTSSSERQNDVLPSYFFLQCNGQPVINDNIAKMVGSPADYINFPVDLTDKMTAKANTPNHLHYFWLQSPVMMSFSYLPRAYTLAVQLVRCLPLETLCLEVQRREPPPMKPTAPAKSNEHDEIGLIATRHRVSLLCPISQSLITLPVKSVYCLHASCFDLRAFLQMNERRLRWTCPLCRKSAAFETLRVDQRLQMLLSRVPPNCVTVEMDSSTDPLHADDRFILETAAEEKPDLSRGTLDSADDYVVLSSGEESENEDDASSEHSSSPATPNSTHENLVSSSTADRSQQEDSTQDPRDTISQPHSSPPQGHKRKDSSSSAENPSEHKRAKRSPLLPTGSANIDIITLSSGESNDLDSSIF